MEPIMELDSLTKEFKVLNRHEGLKGSIKDLFSRDYKIVRAVFTFIIPIGFMAFYPSQVFLRPESIPAVVWFTPLLGCAFFYLSYKVWMKGAMSYNGTGS